MTAASAWLLTAIAPLVAARQLAFVNLLWRHGDRSPVVVYPSDPWQTKDWPQGLGQITPEGMREELKLGQLLHRMYVGSLLDAKYSQFQIHFRSTDVNRTLQSAYSIAAGMWSGTANATIPGAAGWPQPWLPVPVHTIPQWQDHLLYPLTPCKAYDSYKANTVQQSASYRALVSENVAFLRWLSGKAGWTVTIDNIWILGDDAFIEELHNRTEPSWMNQTVYDRIWKLKRASSRYMFQGVHQARLSGGALLTEMLQRMQTFIACRNSYTSHCNWLRRLRVYAYSAHDITVMSLLATLGRQDAVASKGLPPYAAAMALELWQEDDGSYSVRTLYKDGYKAPAFVPIYPSGGCPTGRNCELSLFAFRSQPYLNQNPTVACNTLQPPQTCSPAAYQGLQAGEIVVSLLTVVQGLAVLYVGWKLYQANQSTDDKSSAEGEEYSMASKEKETMGSVSSVSQSRRSSLASSLSLASSKTGSKAPSSKTGHSHSVRSEPIST